MMIVCTILGTACILYYLCIALYAGPAFNFGWFWLMTGAAFLLAAFLRRYPDKSGAVWAFRILLALLAAGFVVIGIMSTFVLRGMNARAPQDIPCAIVLGAQVRGTVPSRALTRRLEAALALPGQPKLILSGGQGDGEQIPEAQCMKDYLTEHGVDEDRLLLEDKSANTRENLLFSDRLYGCAEKPCAIVTNDFHIYRALQIARKAGYQEVYGVAAEGDPLMEVHYVVREAVALLAEKLRAIP